MRPHPETGVPIMVRKDGGPIERVLAHGPGPAFFPGVGRGDIQCGPPVEQLGKKLSDITPFTVGNLSHWAMPSRWWPRPERFVSHRHENLFGQ